MRGDRGRLGALAAHVADHQRPVAAARGEAVVEVAADLVGRAGRQVARGDLRARDQRQVGREQGALERLRDRERSAYSRALSSASAARRPRSSSSASARRGAPPRSREAGGERAVHAPAGQQRDDDERRGRSAHGARCAAPPRRGRRRPSRTSSVQLALAPASRATASRRAGPGWLPSTTTQVSARSRTHSSATVRSVRSSSSDWSNSELASAISAARAQQPLALRLGAGPRRGVAHHDDELLPGRGAGDLERDAGQLEQHAAAPSRRRICTW